MNSFLLALGTFLNTFKSQIMALVAFFFGQRYQKKTTDLKDAKSRLKQVLKEKDSVRKIYESQKKINEKWVRRRAEHARNSVVSEEPEIKLSDTDSAGLRSDRE